MIESENFHEDSKTVEKPTNPKGKSKVDAVIVDNAAQQIQQLQGAVKGLTKLLPGNQQNIQMQQIPQYVPNPVQNNSLYHRLLKVKILLILKVVEMAIEVEVVEVEVEEEEV